jgi:hypothetical protein
MSPSAQRPEARPDLGAEEFRLFPRREVAALVDFVEIDGLVIAPFDPASRSWPTMGHDQRHSILMTRADVDELYVETIDLGHKHWQGIQFRFPLSPVIVRAPRADESLELRQLHALGLIGDGLVGGPPCRQDAPVQIVKVGVGNIDAERTDRIAGGGRAQRRGHYRPTTPAVAAAPRRLRRLVQNDSVDIGFNPWNEQIC